ncbi:MAG: DNA polymerase III subunit gamma/tau [Lachnospiraceae bacterium]|nr:DNA polymerase III subunit gamma/tau [Lachnospiraceae bacterium]
MSYTALYRKFRPDNFDKVKGQDHIVTTLKNQIQANRIGHAYLFCGTRGTGKTTVAKLFAKAVNCEHTTDGSPCNECQTCKSIMSGTSMNVIEIDAASNNGVDNIRMINEEVQYSPTEGKYKVYIIDEVHMLSIGAFNALLKTLEEPPSYVIFILATTEVHKIPITIMSRCQRYDFKHIMVETIEKNLKDLSDIEGLDVEEKALRYIAKAADGSMRDALSLLDQCSAFYIGKSLTYENVLEVLGAVDTEVFSRLLRFIIAGDNVSAIHLLEEIIMNGRELSQFVVDFIWYMRNLLLMKTSDDIENVIDASPERIKALKEEGDMIEEEVLMRYIRVFSELSNQIKYSSQKRVLIEIAIIKLTRPAMENDLSAMLNRISNLEKLIEDGNFTTGMPVATTVVQRQKPSKPKAQIAVPEDVQEVVNNWSTISRKLIGGTRTYIKNARLAAGEANGLYIVFKDSVGYEYVSREDRVREIEELIEEVINKQVKVIPKLLEDNSRFEENYVEIENIINFEIVQEDF